MTAPRTAAVAQPRTRAGRDFLWRVIEQRQDVDPARGYILAIEAEAGQLDGPGVTTIGGLPQAEAQAAPPDALREAATDVLHAWDAGDIDRDYDRIMGAFDSLRAALAAPAVPAAIDVEQPADYGYCIHGVNPDRDCPRCGEGPTLP